MYNEEIIKLTIDFVKKEQLGEASGHDWWHTYRVWKMARYIGEKENEDLYIVELAALLHDIDDYKLHDGNENIGKNRIKQWLEKLDVDNNISDCICEIIDIIKFKGKNVKDNNKLSIEAKIVQDADRLDAIGAVGIARVFAFGGTVNREIYNPDILPENHNTFEEYKNSIKTSTSINHFYEKLLLVKNLMNTETGKELANNRHKYMEEYLNKFKNEWEGLE